MKKLTLSVVALAMLATPAMAGWGGPSSGGGGGVGGTGGGAGTPDLSVDANGTQMLVSGGNNSVSFTGNNSINMNNNNNGNALSAQNINDSPFHFSSLNASPTGDLNYTPQNVYTIQAYAHFERPDFDFHKLSGNDTTTNPDPVDVNVGVIAVAAAGASASSGPSGGLSPFVIFPGDASSADAGAAAGVGVGIGNNPVEVEDPEL